MTFQVTCNDTGPAYERTNVKEIKDTQPAHGTLTQENPGDPFTYTPNQGFVGTDSFQVKSFDDFGFGAGIADRGTVDDPGDPAAHPNAELSRQERRRSAAAPATTRSPARPGGT